MRIFGIFGFIKGKYNKFKLLIGILVGFFLVYLGYLGIHHTSTNDFCAICHVHPEATYSWKKSTHFKNESGVVVDCVQCHLPAYGASYLTEKARLGFRDAYSYMFKDTDAIDWEEKSVVEHAVTYTYDSSCIKCHDDLYSLGLEPKGVEAHEYYLKRKDKLRCINCHITVGHFQPEPVEEFDITADTAQIDIPAYQADTGSFENYTETIPETNVTFNMIAIPGGTFTMGSPESDRFRGEDESTPQEVTLTQFWMGEIEVTWREYDIYYESNASHNNTSAQVAAFAAANADPEVDAVTGPTPPYGSPDQNWGKGYRPAITMSHNSALRYCEWLSEVTGDTYRLPTEAEWEYACKAGTTDPYYFEGDPGKLTAKSWKNRIFGMDDSVINNYVWFARNSKGRSQLPYTNEPNPWGLYNMLGNVKEFCLDWYSPDPFDAASSSGAILNPRGPSRGSEHVVRGGSYYSDPSELRSAARDRTYSEEWFMTDPQSPKSIWWYSDTREVGFRVVREY